MKTLCHFPAQSLVLAVLAMSTLRMKCFWGPYICVFAGAGLAHFDLWNFLVTKLGGRGSSSKNLLVNFIRHIVLIFVIGSLYTTHKPRIDKELENLR